MSESDQAVGEYSAHQREILLETVAKGCRPEQFMLMLELARRYQLDPFAGQIWATPAGIFVGRDGFLVLAHRTGDLDGLETTFEERDGKLFAATCTVWHKRMSHPIKVTVRLDEFYRPVAAGKKPGAWQKMPYVMLQKCAESHALRRAFCITGLYDPSEFAPEDGPAVCETPAPAAATIDGSPVEVSRMPAGPAASAGGLCPRCRIRDSMVPEFWQKYADGFKAVGKILPPGICEDCAKELWQGV